MWSLLVAALAFLLGLVVGPPFGAIGASLDLFGALVLLVMVGARLARFLRHRRLPELRSEEVANLGAEFSSDLRSGRLVGLVVIGHSPEKGSRSVVLGDPARLGPTTVVEAGSVTKGVTGLVLASAVLEGVVALDDDVGALLGLDALGGITLEDLATHRAGLPRLCRQVQRRALIGHPDPYRGIDATRLLRSVRPPSESRWPCYSNLGFALLGLALEEATGRPFARLVEAMVLEPLEMVDSGFDLALGVVGHDRWSLPAPSWHFDAYRAAGGLRTTASDLARLAAALARAPSGRLGDVIELAVRPRRAFGGSRAIGLGWVREGDVVFHNGATGGFWSWVGADLASQTSVAIVAPSEADGRFDSAARRTLARLGATVAK